MNNSRDINKIKALIQSPAAYVEKTSVSVNSYIEVVKLWTQYKKTGKVDLDNRVIKNVFDFHKSDTDHVIMYYSLGHTDCILMCKIRANYLNILVDARPTDSLGDNYIATYC